MNIENFCRCFIALLVGMLLVLIIESARDWGAVYEIRQGEHTWKTYYQPEFRSDGNWRFRDINCDCEVIIGGGYSIKRVK